MEEGVVYGCDTEIGVGRYRGDIAVARGSERTWTAVVGSVCGQREGTFTSALMLVWFIAVSMLADKKQLRS